MEFQVANLVEQCNRRVSESRSIRSIESREIQSSSGPGQPHYVTHRSNFSSYTLYNLVMQIELQCEVCIVPNGFLGLIWLFFSKISEAALQFGRQFL